MAKPHVAGPTAKLQFESPAAAESWVRRAMDGGENHRLQLYDFSNLPKAERKRLALLAVELEDQAGPLHFARQAIRLDQVYMPAELRQILVNEILKPA